MKSPGERTAATTDDGSNIKNWLGLSTEKTKGGSYDRLYRSQ